MKLSSIIDRADVGQHVHIMDATSNTLYNGLVSQMYGTRTWRSLRHKAVTHVSCENSTLCIRINVNNKRSGM